MHTYSRKVRFEQTYTFEARDAAEANEKLERAIEEAEWGGDVRCDGWQGEFEDEPVKCPKCDGTGEMGDNGDDCDHCQGEGEIPFTATK